MKSDSAANLGSSFGFLSWLETQAAADQVGYLATRWSNGAMWWLRLWDCDERASSVDAGGEKSMSVYLGPGGSPGPHPIPNYLQFTCVSYQNHIGSLVN